MNTIPLIPFDEKSAQASILIIYTGGTVGMRCGEDGSLAPFDFSNMPQYLPAIFRMGINITVKAFEHPIDSSNFTPEHWQLIAGAIYENYQNHDGFVVLHGTDTMAYTASAISFMLTNLQKPIVFTGSQLPIDSVRTDAIENLITAIEIASSKKENKAIVPEVCIFFGNKLLRGNRSKKLATGLFHAFASENYPPLAIAGVRIEYNAPYILQPDSAAALKYHAALDNRVGVLKIFPGISQAYMNHMIESSCLRAIILETYGSGNASSAPWFLDALRQAQERDIILVNISQCSGGKVTQGRYASSLGMARLGALSGGDMTVEAALAKLMVMLGEYSPAELKSQWHKSIAGEITPE